MSRRGARIPSNIAALGDTLMVLEQPGDPLLVLESIITAFFRAIRGIVAVDPGEAAIHLHARCCGSSWQAGYTICIAATVLSLARIWSPRRRSCRIHSGSIECRMISCSSSRCQTKKHYLRNVHGSQLCKWKEIRLAIMSGSGRRQRPTSWKSNFAAYGMKICEISVLLLHNRHSNLAARKLAIHCIPQL